jgi:copper chaperone CopZ
MRALIPLVVGIVLLAACDRGESPAPTTNSSAMTVAREPVESGVATVAAAPAPQPAAQCGGACGGSCGGGASCGGASCGGHVADTGPAPAVPANAVWTPLHVAGMRCGGCARRIKSALAHVDGVLGVEVDLATAQVRVATASGVDARGIAQPAIDALGYQVQ